MKKKQQFTIAVFLLLAIIIILLLSKKTMLNKSISKPSPTPTILHPTLTGNENTPEEIQKELNDMEKQMDEASPTGSDTSDFNF